MDYTILYVLAVCAVTVGFVFLISYLEKKNIINKEQMSLVSTILGLGIEILRELKLKDPLIIKISEIVKDSVDLAVSQLKDEEDIVALAEKFAINECNKLDIELTDSRKAIINQLIVTVLKNR